MRDLERAIGRYCDVLTRSLDRTDRAEDRDRYRRHLAEVARWIGMIHGGSDRGEIVARIRRVERAFGWSFLAGPSGEAAEAAKERLLAEVREVAPVARKADEE